MEFRNLSVFMKVGLFSIIFFALSACNNGGSSGVPGVQPIDLTQPRVTSTTPTKDVNDASPGTVAVVFSENVNGVDVSTFLVRVAGAATNLTGTVDYDGPSRTAIFTPDAVNRIRFNANYTVTLTGAAISDNAGNTLDSELAASTDYVFNFSTGDAPIVDISTGLTGDVKEHFLAVDNNGRAASVWRQRNGTNVRIYASLFENDTWQPATMLADITVAAGRRDDGYLSGLVSNGSGFAVQWSRYNQASTFTNNHVSIYTDTNGWTGQDAPVSDDLATASNLLLDTNGDEYVTVWIQSNMIYSRFYTANTWSLITNVAPVSSSAYSLQLASNGSGYGLVWLDLGAITDAMNIPDTSDVVYFNLYNGSWDSQPTRVSKTFPDFGGTTSTSYRPRISSNGTYYAMSWYGQGVQDISRIFSAVMTGIDMMSGDIIWNGPSRISLDGNPSNNIIVSNGTGYFSTWDAYDIDPTADSFIYSSPYFYDFKPLGEWGEPFPDSDITKGTAASPLAFGTNSGYAMIWTAKIDTGANSDDVYGRVNLNGVWQANTLLSDPALGAKRWLTINGSGNQFIAAWAQGPNVGFPIAYVNRYDGTTWETNPLALEDSMTVTSASSDVKTVPLGNGHYMATWLKEVTPGGAKRLDSKFVQAP